MIEDSSEELMAENSEIKTTEEMEEEETEKIIREIPGLDLLPDEQAEPDAADENADQPKPVSSKKELTEKELRALDEENDELLSILDEVMADELPTNEPGKEEFKFLSDDPDQPEELDIDSLVDDDEIFTDTKYNDDMEANPADDEFLLNIEIEEDEEEQTHEVLEKAVEYFRNNDVENGISQLQEAVDVHTDDTSLRYYLAYAMARYAGNYKGAQTELNTLLEQDHTHPDGWFLLGEITEREGDFSKAEDCFEKVLAINPTFPEADYRLGLLLAEHFPEKAEKAAQHLENAIDLDEENPDAIYMYASLLQEQLNQPEKAVHYFEATIALQPNHPFAHYDLAVTHYELGDHEKAVNYYKAAAAINPEVKTAQNDQAFGIIDNLSNDEEATEISLDHSKKTTPATVTKTVLITGATSGIGRATAEVFAQNGYRVIITGRREERLKELVESYGQQYQANCKYLNFDVRDIEAVQQQLDSLKEEWKEIDILINNAGLSRGLSPIHEGDLEHWETMIDTNVKGLLYLTRAIVPHMVKRQNGHIINVSSTSGTEAYPGGNVYCATKAAVSMLTRSMRLDLHKHNIRVGQISPGHVEETEFASVRFDGDTEKAQKVYENFQPLRARDVAETIYFMATRPPHVNIQDIYMFGTQQASATTIDRSGR